jgi:hypothetical protein
VYNSKIKTLAYEIKKLGLTLDSMTAGVKLSRIATSFHKKEKFAMEDLRVQLMSIGGKC